MIFSKVRSGHPEESIFSRLYWAFVSSSLLLIVLAGLFYYVQARHSTEQQIKEQLAHSMNEVVALFEKAYQTPIEGSLLLLESSPTVDNFFYFQQKQLALIRFDIERQFSQLIRSHPNLYRAIRLVDAFGQEQVIVQGKSRVRDYRSLLKDKVGQPSHNILTSLFEELKTGNPRDIVFSQPFHDDDENTLFYVGIAKLEPEIGGFGGAIIFACSLAEFIETVNQVRTFGHNVAWLLNADNHIIKQPLLVKQQLGSEQSVDPRPLLSLSSASASDGVLSQSLYPGSPAPSRAFMQIVMSIPPNILQQQNLAILKSLLLLGAVAILFTSLVAWWVSRQITLPITELVKASRLLAQGNFDTRSQVKDNSEIGVLASSFNQMAEQLKHTMNSRKIAEEALQQSHEALELVLNSTGEGIYGIDNNGLCSFCNVSALLMLGFSDEQELIGRNMHELIQYKNSAGKKYVQQDSPIFLTTQTAQSAHQDNEVFWRADGSQFPIEYRAHPIKQQQQLIGAVVTFTDIKARQQAEVRLRTLSQAVEQSPVSVILTDIKGHIYFINNAYERATGLTAEVLAGQFILQLFKDEEDKQRSTELWDKANKGEPSEDVIRSINTEGKECWEQVYISPVTGQNGETISYLVLIENITERKQQENKITHQAHHDMLTGLPNRFLAMDRLDRLLRGATRSDELAAVLFIDLDGFKKVNDMLGHEVGDQLLIEAARRLASCVRDEDTVGRLGGDEFIVLLGSLTSSNNAQPVAESILKTFRQPFYMDEHELLLTTSIGIALFPGDGKNAVTLLRNADIAMYESKRGGRNTYHFFTEELNASIQRRLEVEEQLHHAMNKNEFFLVYQPILDIKTMQITGAEVLLRWHSEKLGSVGPDEFVPIAEQTGLITVIGEYVLYEAIKQIGIWQKKFSRQLTISVNVSPRQFHTDELYDNVIANLKNAGINNECLQMELTEGVLMSGHKRVEKILDKLHKADIHIVMDDFGTGYSSLSYLRKYPFNKIKIDRSFVRDIHQDPADRELVIAALNMAHGLGLKVVAEGIESEDQLSFLRQHGCEYGQGYLFSKPVLAEDFEVLLQDGKYCTMGS